MSRVTLSLFHQIYDVKVQTPNRVLSEDWKIVLVAMCTPLWGGTITSSEHNNFSNLWVMMVDKLYCIKTKTKKKKIVLYQEKKKLYIVVVQDSTNFQSP